MKGDIRHDINMHYKIGFYVTSFIALRLKIMALQRKEIEYIRSTVMEPNINETPINYKDNLNLLL